MAQADKRGSQFATAAKQSFRDSAQAALAPFGFPVTLTARLAQALRSQQARDALAKKFERFTSLDTPQDETAAEIAADIGAGFIPGVGQAQAVRDFERARREGSSLGMGLATAAMIPVAGGVAKAASKSKKLASLLSSEARERLGREYPQQVPGVLKTDPKTGKEFIGKEPSAEELALAKVRAAAQKDIAAGNYTPFFDVEKRYYVDPKNYPLTGKTIEDVMPKKQATIDKWVKELDTPEARARLDAAYAAGKADPLAAKWYAMGQLEDEFIKELGEVEGRKAFKERFAQSMAATTGGADPTANLLMSAYANFMKQKGAQLPTVAADYPHPVGGRYMKSNRDVYNRALMEGKGLTTDTPKRFNFAADFMGHLDRPTIDEQMTGLIDPTLTAPPGDTYGIFERMTNEAAERAGIAPGRSVEFQDVAWAGKKGVGGKPMIQHVNEAIERTARVTGKSPQEVLRGYIRANAPLYGLAPIAAAPMFLSQDNE